MKLPTLRLPATAFTAIAMSAVVAFPTQAPAQIPIIGNPTAKPSPSPSPTPTASPNPTPTATAKPPSSPNPGPSKKPSKKPSSNTASKPKPKGTAGGGSSGGTSSSGRPSGGTSSGASSATGGADSWGGALVVGPPSGGEGGFGLANWATRDRTASRTTTELLELLAEIHGEPTKRQLSEGFGGFPVQGYTWYQDDYGAPRFIGRASLHAGIDLFAARGTPISAVVDGVIWKYARGGRGGFAIWLLGDNGVRYYYGHMDGFAFRPTLGRRLTQGEVIGYVGDTGSAKGTPPHLHFEVNPGHQGTVNPKSHLDGWLDEAMAAARLQLENGGPANVLLPESNAGWTGILELLNVPMNEPPKLWMLGLDPTSSVALADDAIDDLLAARSWEGFVDRPFVGATGPGQGDPFGLGLDVFYGGGVIGYEHG